MEQKLEVIEFGIQKRQCAIFTSGKIPYAFSHIITLATSKIEKTMLSLGTLTRGLDFY